MSVDIHDVITCETFCDDRLRGSGVARGRISRFPIDLRRRPYNTLALPCECVSLLSECQFGRFGIPRYTKHIVIYRGILVYDVGALSDSVATGSRSSSDQRLPDNGDNGRRLTVRRCRADLVSFSWQSSAFCFNVEPRLDTV